MNAPHGSRARRGLRVLTVVGAAVAATMLGVMMGATGATASALSGPHPVGSQLGGLKLSPRHGDMTTNPAASWSTRGGCPSDFQARASLAIVTRNGDAVRFNNASRPVVPANTPTLSGTFNGSMALQMVADGLEPGHAYEVVVRCFNADLQSVAVQSTFIRINRDATGWHVLLLFW